MNEGWIVFGIIFLVLLGSTLPLLHKDNRSGSRQYHDKNHRSKK